MEERNIFCNTRARKPSARNFQPRVREQFDIAPLLPDLREGMLAAVLYGTAKRSYDPDGEQDLGKTGTCNDEGAGRTSRLVCFLRRSSSPENRDCDFAPRRRRIISGPHASEIAGRIYRGLYQRNYFARDNSSSRQYASSPAASDSFSSP